jgi:hypothetical protein
MTSTFTNVFSQEDIEYLQQLPEVLRAKSDLINRNVVYFSVQVTDSIREAMRHVGLDLSQVQSVPMRWIKGDTAPHVDVGATAFDKTFLVYLNNSAGSLVIDSAEYPIRENAGYVFHEGLNHQTIHTGSEPRLLLGPMNEHGCRVGGPTDTIHYYANQADADNQTNEIAAGPSFNYVVGNIDTGSIGTITQWIIATNSDGPSTGSCSNGDELIGGELYYYNLYPASVPCFLAGTRIQTPSGYKAIETLNSGDKVRTADGRAVPIKVYTTKVVTNAITAPYRICAGSLGANYPVRDLYITGYHAIKDARGVWQMPKELANITQCSVGESVTYYHIACPSYFKDDLIAEGMVVESFGFGSLKKSPYLWKANIGGYIRKNPADRSHWWMSEKSDPRPEPEEQKEKPIQEKKSDRTSWWRSKSSAK